MDPNENPNLTPSDVEGMVRAAAEAYDIDPDHLVRMAHQESGFNPSKVSPKGATGVMQLMPATAKDLGVDPKDPLQNIEGGARYFRGLLDRFGGDYTKATAAYNAGPEVVAQNRPLPQETQDYLAAIGTPKPHGKFSLSDIGQPPQPQGHGAFSLSDVSQPEAQPAPAAEPQALTPPPPPKPTGVPVEPVFTPQRALAEGTLNTISAIEKGGENLKKIGSSLAELGAGAGTGVPMPVPPARQTQLSRAPEAAKVLAGVPLIPLSEIGPDEGFIHGALQRAEGLTTPVNAALMVAIPGLGKAAAEAPGMAAAVTRDLASLGLNAYFTSGLWQSLGAEKDKAIEAYRKGDWNGLKEAAGGGLVDLVMAGLATKEAAGNIERIGNAYGIRIGAPETGVAGRDSFGGTKPGERPQGSNDTGATAPPGPGGPPPPPPGAPPTSGPTTPPTSQEDLYQQIIGFVRQQGKASTSSLQRNFKLGYGAASKILDRLESEGIVGPANGNRPRDILPQAPPPEAGTPSDANAPEGQQTAPPPDRSTQEIVRGGVFDTPQGKFTVRGVTAKSVIFEREDSQGKRAGSMPIDQFKDLVFPPQTPPSQNPPQPSAPAPQPPEPTPTSTASPSQIAAPEPQSVSGVPTTAGPIPPSTPPVLHPPFTVQPGAPLAPFQSIDSSLSFPEGRPSQSSVAPIGSTPALSLPQPSMPAPAAPEPNEETPPPPVQTAPTGAPSLIDAVYDKLKSGQSLGNVNELMKLAEQHFGSSRTSGQWTPKDAFDAMEAGINKYLIDRGAELMSMPYDQAMGELRGLMDHITSQGIRTEEQVQKQQFSTPPTESFTVAKAAGIRPDDVVLEPSAGNGGLVVWPKAIGAQVHVNEISDRRRAMLEAIGFTGATAHDGEILNSLLDRGVKPTVVLMNPPFSAGTVKSNEAKNKNLYGFNHVDAALQRLQPGGRLVAILGGGRADDSNGGASLNTGPSGKWFERVAKQYNIRANIRVNGKEYQKYGTNFATRIIVIDKSGPTPSQTTPGNVKTWDSVTQGNVDTLEEAYNLLKDVAAERPGSEVSPRPAGGVRPGQGNAPTGVGAGAGAGGPVPGGVLPGGGGTPSANGPAGGPAEPSGGPGNNQPGAGNQQPGVRQPGSEPEGSAGTTPAGSAPGSPENAAPERPLEQPQTLGGLTPEQVAAAAAKALARKLGLPIPERTPAPAPPTPTPAPPPRAPRKAPAAPAPPKPETRIRNAASDAADAARQRLKAKLAQQDKPAGLQSRADEIQQDVIDLATIGAEHMLNGATGFDDWSNKLQGDVGDLVNLVAQETGTPAADLLKQVFAIAQAVSAQLGPKPLQGDETTSNTITLEREEYAGPPTEDTDAYVTYRPTIKGAPHPGEIVETKTMATVPLPAITYRPHLPEWATKRGISAVQMEAVAIAGQQNAITLPNGAYASALIGDGTGVGKGRIAASILWDNYRQGRKRLVWVSEKWDLMQDAIRDLYGIEAKDLLRMVERGVTGQYTTPTNAAVQPFKKFASGTKIDHDGVLFSTYALIRSENNKGDRRVAQLEDYLRGNDDGEGAYILFDEAHNLKNAVANQGGQTSQIGRAVKELLDRMPKLRTVSLSATAATDVVNLGYLDRLGLWGPGTPFPNGFNEFQTQIAPGGMAAMEMIARELKAQGKYLSRTLSFKGVTYDEAEHNLTDDQKELYRTASRAWGSVLENAEASIQQTTNGGSRQLGRFMAQFYGAQQRFFNLLITTLKIPKCIELANQALADNKSVVITLVNTNEAAQNREKNKAKDLDDSEEPPDFDFGPKEMLMQLVRDHFPVQQYRDDVDSAGNPIKVPVYRKDKDGREIPVNNPAAEAARDALIAQLDKDLNMPENPLDILIQSLGGDKKVAELTGRKEKFDRNTGKFVPRGDPNAKRDQINLFEMAAFQSGKKRVAILSNAAGTGISLHAGNDVANKQKRYHITLQVGWSADKAMQMFGRTHRTNEAHPPEYVMLVSDLGGERRFVATIARRLGSLGALTKGQKNAASGSADLMEKVNFETDQGKQATNSFYQSLLMDRPVPGTGLTGLQILTDLHVLKMQGGTLTVPQADRTNVTRLLNRLLALDPDVQNAVYNYFYDIFQASVQDAIDNGTLDTGVKTLPGDEFEVKQSRPISKDPRTGAETYYYQVDAKIRTKRLSPEDLDKRLASNRDANARILRNDKGDVILAVDARPIVHSDGRAEPASYVYKPSRGEPVKLPNAQFHRYVEVSEWATKRSAELQASIDRIKSDINWYTQYAGPNSPQVAPRHAQLQNLQQELGEVNAATDNPEQWARDRWKELYEASPAHITEPHHLIGGAVMRWWNPIKDSTFVRNSIFTTSDSKTGQRVVGIDIPADRIGDLLNRITGGGSTVDVNQLYTDVLRNGLTYQLEGGIQVRQGRIGREPVIQLIPPNRDIAQNLTRNLGVMYEKGAVPVYYIPNNDQGPTETRTRAILAKVLQTYPVKPEAPASLASRVIPGFYSQLEQTIQQKMPERASGAQIEGIVKNPQNGVKPDELKWTGFDEWLKQQKGPISKQQALDFLKQNHAQVSEEGGQGRYEQYTLPGRRNYRELLLTLPLRQVLNSSSLQNYSSPHWNVPNVVAHVRFTDHESPDGKKVLVIEEIQSDWHEAGRKNGYRTDPATIPLRVVPAGNGWEIRTDEGRFVTNVFGGGETEEEAIAEARRRLASRDRVSTDFKNQPPEAPFAKNWHELAFRRALRWAVENGYDSVAWTTGAQQASRYDLAKHVSGIAWQPSTGELYIRKIKADDYEAKPLETAVTAENLADYIGKDAATRLLAQPVDESGYHKLEGSRLSVGGQGMNVFYDQIIPSYARKLGKKWGADVGDMPILISRGGGLSQPKAKPAPQAVEQFARQHGFDKVYLRGRESEFSGPWKRDAEAQFRQPGVDALLVGDTAITKTGLQQDPNGNAVYYRKSQAGRWGRPSQTYRVRIDLPSDLPEPVAAKESTEKKPVIRVVHSMDITPAMRESVMQGQPLFARNVSPGAGELPIHRLENAPTAANPNEPTEQEVENYWAGAKFQPDIIEGVPVLWTNNSAFDMMARRVGYTSPETVKEVFGVPLDALQRANIIAEANYAAKNPDQQAFERALVAIGDQLRQMPDGPMIVVQSGGNVFDGQIQYTLREELNHVLQMGLPGGLHGLPADLLDTPLGKRASRALALRGYSMPKPGSLYYEHNRAVMAAEVSVRLMEPGLYRELALTRDEAIDLAEQFLTRLLEDHGDNAEAVTEKIRETIQAIEATTGGQRREQHAGGTEGVAQGGKRGPPQVPGESAPSEAFGLASRRPGEVASEYAALARPRLRNSPPEADPDFLNHIEAKYEPLVKGAPGHVYINREAEKAIQLGLEISGIKQNPFHGVTLGFDRVQALLHGLDVLQRIAPNDSVRAGVTALRGEVETALSELPVGGRYVTFAGSEERTSPLTVRETRKEEEFHRQQLARNQGDAFLNHSDTDLLRNDPATQDAWTEVERHLPGASPQQVALELGALLATGRNQELGLSKRQAGEAFQVYYNDVVARHGAGMEGLIHYAHPKIREILEETQRLPDRRRWPGRRPRSGEGGPGPNPGGTGRSVEPGQLARQRGGSAPPPNPPNATESGQLSRPRLPNLNTWFTSKFGSDTPRVNYSGLGAFGRTFLPGRQFMEVEKASRPVFEAALPAASSDAITSTILQSAIPAIKNALKDSGYNWPDLQLYYIESRLRGLRERWRDFADQARGMSDQDAEKAIQPLADGEKSPFLDLLSKIEGRRGLAQNLGQTAAAIAESKDWDTLKEFLALSFEDTADRVATAVPPDRFDEITDAIRTNPKVKEADRLYGDLIENPMAESHAVNEGVFSNALGPAGRYYPLVPLQKPQAPPPGRRLAYHKPQNAANKFATGLSDAYDPGMEALAKRLTYGNRGNYKAALIQTMRDEGWLVKESEAFHPPEGGLMMIGPDGIEYKAVREETQQARTLIQNGKVIHLPARFEVMPGFMNRGLKTTLQREPMDPDSVIRLMHWANMLATRGPLELAFHSAGVLGALYANTPFLGPSGLDKALSLPIVKWFGLRGKAWKVDPTSPENVAKLHEMARAGAIPAKSGKVTYSKEYAEMTGAKRERFSFSPMLYGPKGLDARARILMYDIFKAAYPKGTTSDLHHFVNQLANYTPEMRGPIENFLKKIGIGPFATAGMTRIVNSVNNWSGMGPQTGQTLQSKLFWWLMASAWIGLAAWIVAYKHLTGLFPWEDKRAQLFMLPVGGRADKLSHFRYSDVGKALWGNGPEVGQLNFAWLDNPLALRGARAMGIADAFKAHQLGANAGQISEAAEKGVLNSFAHPALGPATRAMFVGITGESPYVTSLRDRGRIGIQFYPAIPPATKPGLATQAAKSWAALKQLNSFYTEGAENLGDLTGFSQPRGPAKKGSWWWKEAGNVLTPGLVGSPSNPWKASNAIRQEQHYTSLPHYAKGGVILHPEKAVVGEAGPEAIVDLKDKDADSVSSLTTTPLSPEGIADAEKVGQRLKAKGGLDMLIPSGLVRAKQTAETIANQLGIQISAPNEDLNTWCLGELDGKTRKEIEPALDDYVKHKPDTPLPGVTADSQQPGQSFNQFRRRALNAIQDLLGILKEHPDEKIGAVTSSKVLRLVRAWDSAGARPSMDIDDAKYIAKNRIPFGEVWRLYYSSTGKLKLQPVNLKMTGKLDGGLYLIRHGNVAEGGEVQIVDRPTVMTLGKTPQAVVPLSNPAA